jgi:hypothetical protein
MKELHIGLLILWDSLNGALPVHLPIPMALEVADLMRQFDADGNGLLDRREFSGVLPLLHFSLNRVLPCPLHVNEPAVWLDAVHCPSVRLPVCPRRFVRLSLSQLFCPPVSMFDGPSMYLCAYLLVGICLFICRKSWTQVLVKCPSPHPSSFVVCRQS